MCCATSMRLAGADKQARPLSFRSLVARRIEIGSIERRLDALVCDGADFTVPAQRADALVSGPRGLQQHGCVVGEFDGIAVIHGVLKVEKSLIFEPKRVCIGRSVSVESPDRRLESMSPCERDFPGEPSVFGNLKPSHQRP